MLKSRERPPPAMASTAPLRTLGHHESGHEARPHCAAFDCGFAEKGHGVRTGSPRLFPGVAMPYTT